MAAILPPTTGLFNAIRAGNMSAAQEIITNQNEKISIEERLNTITLILRRILVEPGYWGKIEPLFLSLLKSPDVSYEQRKKLITDIDANTDTFIKTLADHHGVLDPSQISSLAQSRLDGLKELIRNRKNQRSDSSFLPLCQSTPSSQLPICLSSPNSQQQEQNQKVDADCSCAVM